MASYFLLLLTYWYCYYYCFSGSLTSPVKMFCYLTSHFKNHLFDVWAYSIVFRFYFMYLNVVLVICISYCFCNFYTVSSNHCVPATFFLFSSISIKKVNWILSLHFSFLKAEHVITTSLNLFLPNRRKQIYITTKNRYLNCCIIIIIDHLWIVCNGSFDIWHAQNNNQERFFSPYIS